MVSLCGQNIKWGELNIAQPIAYGDNHYVHYLQLGAGCAILLTWGGQEHKDSTR